MVSQSQSTSEQRRSTRPGRGLLRILSWSPWLKLVGAFLTFVLICIYTASQSELGAEISAGESPVFSWLRQHVIALLILALAYLALTSVLHHLWLRFEGSAYPWAMKLLTGGEVVALGVLAMAVVSHTSVALAWGHLFLQFSLLTQILLSVAEPNGLESTATFDIFKRKQEFPLLFLSLVFLMGAVPAFLDPSWQRLEEYVLLDSAWEYVLCRLVPPLISGIVAVWLAVAIMIVLSIFRLLWKKLPKQTHLKHLAAILPFLLVSALYATICIALLFKAIEWEISRLSLRDAIVPLFIVVAGGGGALSYAAFLRLAPHIPKDREHGLVGIVALSMGAVLVFPFVWLLNRPTRSGWSWRLLTTLTLVVCISMGVYLLHGDLFNPWFTAFSYLKGALLKMAALAAAGSLCLISGEFISGRARTSATRKRKLALVTAICVLAVFPFAVLEKYPETKAAVLQFNEISRVDAVYARGLANSLGVGMWIRLGQDPKPSNRPPPWPLPWTLKKTGPSMLPQDFNLLVVVVDALRGDAFHSAGYHRNLTPFLDKWALEETVSFARAYSQGGGSFASFPFLVGGRSYFTLYGPNLYHQNLYFKLALAEGIPKVMVVKDFGPRAIFPPDFPVIELGDDRSGTDHHSAPADQVFGWSMEAIDSLTSGERFLCFLHLMDVHNDLWKKRDGIDFGDGPRDLYDNNLSHVDKAFQRFVTWLKKKGIYERTVILFTSDHGEQFWEHGASLHGHTLYEEEIRIPLILLAHGIRDRIEDVPVIAADMAPTIAELAGYSVQPPYDDTHMGISLVPLLMGRERDRYINRDVVGRASFKRRYFLYRNWAWKLVYFAELDVLQLFNTVEDPSERTNLVQEKPNLAAELEKELLRYLDRIEGRKYRPVLSGSLAND